LKKFFLDIHLLCHIVQQEVISRSSSGAQQNLLIAYCTSHSQPIHNFTYGTFSDSQTTNLWLTAFLLAIMHLLHGSSVISTVHSWSTVPSLITLPSTHCTCLMTSLFT